MNFTIHPRKVGGMENDLSAKAVKWFTKFHPSPPKRKDGSIAFEDLFAEFVAEGVKYGTIQKHYDALASDLKSPNT